MNGKMEQDRWKPEVPDHAKDMHTAEGKRMRRGFKHFYDEGPSDLVNQKEGSKYYESARDYDLKVSKQKPANTTTPKTDSNKAEGDLDEKEMTEKVS